ncbi:MAG: Fur family transcriptional regulator [Acidimicrobiales bacterium]|nr:transcriptional repressor [Actinomycetota bacterium]
MSTELHDTATVRLRKVHQRYTRGRRALVDVLSSAERPLSIPEIVSADRSVPQSSVYRNLTVLEQAGVVSKVQGGDDFSRFELAEDLTSHHHHLVCVECGSVDDYTVPPRFEQTMAKTLDNVAAETGFRAQFHRLDLVGVCARCA